MCIRDSLTGAVASVSTQDLIRSGRTDAVGAMQGALPGVQIQRSNSPSGISTSGDFCFMEISKVHNFVWAFGPMTFWK